jgi:signal transduction histidine kinase
VLDPPPIWIQPSNGDSLAAWKAHSGALAARLNAWNCPTAAGDHPQVRAADAQSRYSESHPRAAARLQALLAGAARIETDYRQRLQQEKLEAMAELAAGAGHEINNPLTVISGRVQLFLQQESDPERRRSLAVINSQALRVSEMISNMMLFARPPEPRPQRVDLVEVIGQLVQSLEPQTRRRRAEIRAPLEQPPCWIEADRNQLLVALRAVCENALEATGFGARVDIALQSDPGTEEVAICVSDDGPGIAPQVQRHLFDPFYSGRQAGRGLGLGLSKCWRIVTNHGGRVEVTSELGRGSRFRLILPRRCTPPSAQAGDAA